MDHLSGILEIAEQTLTTRSDPSVMDWLAGQLATAFDDASNANRIDEFKKKCRSHRIFDLLLTDPYTRRAYEKPSGYAGDAVMLDYIYRPARLPLPEPARTIHLATTTLPNALSVLWRRDHLASHLIRLAKTSPGASCLSVACGHMRELDKVSAADGPDLKILAIDQDRRSLATLRSDYPGIEVDARADSIMSIIKGNYQQKHELIYSAGLFDYLPNELAVHLIRSMYGLLQDGGVMSVGNFTPDSHGRGFMAAFMDWTLLYRDESAMRRLFDAALPGVRQEIFRDHHRNVVYVEIGKR